MKPFGRLLLSALIALAGLCLPRATFAQLATASVVQGLTGPVGFVQVPSDPTAQVILQKGGRVRLLKNGVLQETDYLDLSGIVKNAGEAGLLGLAFSPHYAQDGRVFICFVNHDGFTVIARLRHVAGNPLRADIDSRADFQWPGGQPYIETFAGHHFGGHIAFGPDGYLYIGLGDSDEANDPAHIAQNPAMLGGKMLRIDVSVSDEDPEGYDVPPTNPFAEREDVLGVIWDFGLRNPWRWSFDAPALGGTGALIIGDVGQDAWEEINYEPAGSGGRNYGWRNREGRHDHITDLAAFSAPVDPIFELDRDSARSIIGGVVYRGSALGDQYRGRYFFGDFVAGQVWSLGLQLDNGSGEASVADVQLHTALETGAVGLSSFGTDAAGEIYLVSYLSGTVARVVRDTTAPPDGDGDGLPDGSDACPGVAAQTANGCPVIPPLGDFNGDGRADVVFQSASTPGLVAAWHVDGLSIVGGSYLLNTPALAGPGWSVVGTSDMTGDNKPDLLYQNQISGQAVLFIMDGITNIGVQEIASANQHWRIMATGDFNRDGRADLVWENFATGDVYIGYFTAAGGQSVNTQQGSVIRFGNGTPVPMGPSAWRIAGAGDVDGDGYLDLVWQDSSTGNLTVWFLQGVVYTGSVPQIVFNDPTWQVRAVGDFNADGHPDLIFQNTATGTIAGWLLNGLTILQGTVMGQSFDMQVVGAK